LNRMEDGIRESQRRATRGLETLHNGINSLTWLRRLNIIATDVRRDPMLEHGDMDALDQAIALLKSVVLPALQEKVLDNCDDDTQGDFRGREAQSKDDEFPTTKRRRRSHSHPPPWRSQSMPRFSE
jgi:hypothetical protein